MFHWTFDYIDGLSIGQISDIFQIVDGRNKGEAYLLKKPKGK